MSNSITILALTLTQTEIKPTFPGLGLDFDSYHTDVLSVHHNHDPLEKERLESATRDVAAHHARRPLLGVARKVLVHAYLVSPTLQIQVTHRVAVKESFSVLALMAASTNSMAPSLGPLVTLTSCVSANEVHLEHEVGTSPLDLKVALLARSLLSPRRVGRSRLAFLQQVVAFYP